MKRSRSRTLVYAWIALLAIVYSALSPLLAAVVLSDRPAALGRMLGIPSDMAAMRHAHAEHSPSNGHMHEAAAHGAARHHDRSSAPGDGSARHEHGIYCSFCLNAASTVALVAAPPSVGVPVHHISVASLLRPPPPLAAARYPDFRSRAPPRLTTSLS